METGQPSQGTSLSVDDGAAALEGLLARGNFLDDDADDAGEEKQDQQAGDDQQDDAGAQDSASEQDEADVDESGAEGTDAEPDAQSEEPVTFETLSDLAKELDVPLEELMANLKHTITVDGEESQVTLKELQAGYQKDRDYRQKTEALSREREEFIAKSTQAFEQFHRHNVEMAALFTAIEQAIVGDIKSADMARLRAENPQEWQIRRIDMQDRLDQLRQIRQAAANQYVEREKQHKNELQEHATKYLEKQRALLKEKLPTFDKIKDGLTNYLRGEMGFTPEELNGVFDHRLLVLAHKAMQFDAASKQAANVVKQKVKPAPTKVVKPTKPMGKVAIQRARIGSARNALKKSGSLQDAANVILAAGIGGITR